MIEWIQEQLQSDHDNPVRKKGNGLHRDFMVNRKIAVECLDKMQESFSEEGIKVTLTDILLLAVSMARRDGRAGKLIANCISDDADPKDRRGIIRFTEIGEKNLAYLFSEAIDEIGAENAIDFAAVASLWEKWADDGLKILYCNYYSRYFNLSPSRFFDMLINAEMENSQK